MTKNQDTRTKQGPITKIPTKGVWFLELGHCLVIASWFLVFFCCQLSVLPVALAEHKSEMEESGEETSPAQAQATLASLFSRGAKMPGIPRMNGTIALPSFDSPGMKIDEESLRKTESKTARN
jgi:hypothetical protein